MILLRQIILKIIFNENQSCNLKQPKNCLKNGVLQVLALYITILNNRN